MGTKFIDVDGLTFFKQQQDAVNGARFMNNSEFVGEDGQILNEKLPDERSIQTATLEDINALFDETTAETTDD